MNTYRYIVFAYTYMVKGKNISKVKGLNDLALISSPVKLGGILLTLLCVDYIAFANSGSCLI